MNIIDTRGHICPIPLIMAKSAIKEASTGDVLLIISDNETSCQNLMQYLTDLGANPQKETKGNEFHITITVPAPTASMPQAESYCSTDKGYAVVIKSDRMGMGDDNLGSILIRAFINSLKDADKLPTHLILYNAGVKLAVNGTDTSSSLVNLESLGVKIIVCGTCADFFGIKENLAAGTISNMYQITKITAEAGHVIYP
jgi:selenium metabolism protein YedF